MKMERINSTLPPALASFLKNRAQVQGRQMTDVVREGLFYFMEAIQERENTRSPPGQGDLGLTTCKDTTP